MARVRMVTRTINVTNAEVMCLTVSKAEVCTKTFKISGNISDKAEALKLVKKSHETDDFKPTAIVSLSTNEVLYGMTEEQFISLAEVLPPRKIYGDNADENDGE